MVQRLARRGRRIDSHDLVTISDIARLAGVKRSTANMWDQRGDVNGFPRPVDTPLLEVGQLFLWHEVENWLINTGKVDPDD